MNCPFRPKWNMNQQEWLALQGLANNNNIVIKQINKGGLIVILDVENYEKKVRRTL